LFIFIFSGKLNLFKHVFAIAAPGTNIRDSLKKLCAVYKHVGRPASAKPVRFIICCLVACRVYFH